MQGTYAWLVNGAPGGQWTLLGELDLDTPEPRGRLCRIRQTDMNHCEAITVLCATRGAVRLKAAPLKGQWNSITGAYHAIFADGLSVTGPLPP